MTSIPVIPPHFIRPHNNSSAQSSSIQPRGRGALRQKNDDIHLRNITIKREIASGMQANDKLPFAIRHRTTDKGVLLQDIQGGNDFADALTGIFDLIGCQGMQKL